CGTYTGVMASWPDGTACSGSGRRDVVSISRGGATGLLDVQHPDPIGHLICRCGRSYSQYPCQRAAVSSTPPLPDIRPGGTSPVRPGDCRWPGAGIGYPGGGPVTFLVYTSYW